MPAHSLKPVTTRILFSCHWRQPGFQFLANPDKCAVVKRELQEHMGEAKHEKPLQRCIVIIKVKRNRPTPDKYDNDGPFYRHPVPVNYTGFAEPVKVMVTISKSDKPCKQDTGIICINIDRMATQRNEIKPGETCIVGYRPCRWFKVQPGEKKQ